MTGIWQLYSYVGAGFIFKRPQHNFLFNLSHQTQVKSQAVSIQHLETELNAAAQGVTELRGETVNKTEQVNVLTNLAALLRRIFSCKYDGFH